MTDAAMLDQIDGKICWCLDELTDRLAGDEVTEQIVHLSTAIRELMQARKLFNDICKDMEPKEKTMSDAVTKYIKKREETEAKLYARIQKIEARQASVDEALRCLMRLLPEPSTIEDVIKEKEPKHLKVYESAVSFSDNCAHLKVTPLEARCGVSPGPRLCRPTPDVCPRLRPPKNQGE